MTNKYVLLKDAIGIVIFLDMEEVICPHVLETDILVVSNVYLRISAGISLQKEIIVEWIGKGIRDVARDIYQKVNGQSICFDLKRIDFDDAHFQNEALYCAVQEWISKYYGLKLPTVNIDLDFKRHTFIFHIPS